MATSKLLEFYLFAHQIKIYNVMYSVCLEDKYTMSCPMDSEVNSVKAKSRQTVSASQGTQGT